MAPVIDLSPNPQKIFMLGWHCGPNTIGFRIAMKP